MNVAQKEIVLVEYPFSDLRGSKLRPALIISNEKFNNFSDDCLAVPLTTVLKHAPYSVHIDQSDLNSGELFRPSRIRIDKIFSVEKNLIIKKLGVLSTASFEKVKTMFLSII